MNFTDKAIVISARKYSESSGIVSLLTQSHGLCKGLVRNITSKKQRGIYQMGNFLEATWKGRLSEHLGNFNAEIVASNAAYFLSDSKKLTALTAASALIDKTLSEREMADDIFQNMFTLIESLKYKDHWHIDYINLELLLLSHLGFRLQLDKCAATDSINDLFYISPKSGKAVSRASGYPYKDKLFTIPDLFIGKVLDDNESDILNSLNICAYFLEKYIFTPHNIKLPESRLRLNNLFSSETIYHC